MNPRHKELRELYKEFKARHAELIQDVKQHHIKYLEDKAAILLSYPSKYAIGTILIKNNDTATQYEIVARENIYNPDKDVVTSVYICKHLVNGSMHTVTDTCIEREYTTSCKP